MGSVAPGVLRRVCNVDLLDTSFVLAMDGVATEELEPWQENGDPWRRLKVTFPESIATHNTVQTFYFGSDGLLRRHAYDADVLGGSPARGPVPPACAANCAVIVTPHDASGDTGQN
jgi:hypothetical protein